MFDYKRWIAPDVVSNLAFVISAVIVGLGNGFTGGAFIASMTFLTTGSIAYHSGISDANDWDVMAIYAVGISLWIYTLFEPINAIIGLPAGVYTPLVALTMIVFGSIGAFILRMKYSNIPLEVKVGVMFTIIYVTAFIIFGFNSLLLTSIGLMIVALLIRSKFHWLWHLLSGTALALLFAGVTASSIVTS